MSSWYKSDDIRVDLAVKAAQSFDGAKTRSRCLIGIDQTVTVLV